MRPTIRRHNESRKTEKRKRKREREREREREIKRLIEIDGERS